MLYRVRLTVTKMADRLPPIVSSVYMGNVFYSAESSIREQKDKYCSMHKAFSVTECKTVMHQQMQEMTRDLKDPLMALPLSYSQ